MSTGLQICINFSAFSSLCNDSCKKQSYSGLKLPQPIKFYCLSRTKNGVFHQNEFKFRSGGKRWSFLRGSGGGAGVFLRDERWRRKRRVVVVGFNQGFGFNGGGGGGGKDDGGTARLLGNLALAIGLTYLSVTGQLGWVLDAIVSIWLIAVLLPIVGLGAFLWWAGRDIVQSTCPNCGNEFQIFKSLMNNDLQLCPYCSQPFSVEDNKFIKEPVKFSNQATTFEQAFSDFFPGSKKGKESSTAVVDVEAEIRDAE